MSDTKKFPAMHIEFEDGRQEDVRLDPPALHLAFRRAAGRRPDLEDLADLFHMCYLKLGQPEGPSESGLERWMGTIFDYEQSTVEVARPTKGRTTSSKE